MARVSGFAYLSTICHNLVPGTMFTFYARFAIISTK